MYFWIIASTALLSIVALIITLYVLKQESDKMKRYEEEGDSAENELIRSHEYETKSLSTNVRNLSWIYLVFIIGSLIALAIFIYMN